MNSNIKAFGIAIVLGIALVVALSMSKKKNSIKSKSSTGKGVKENYQDVFFANDYSKGNWVSRPNLRADLDPRFDSTRVNGGKIAGSFPGLGVQGVPLTPITDIIADETVSNPNFATMGGVDGAYEDSRLPSGGLTSTQVNEILAGKFGRNSEAYTDPKMLLPVPDMKKSLAKDPSDPGTFVYDRYLFAPLKRRYAKVDVDHIRGDLAIPQLRMGWFDPNPVAAQDLTQGYFSDYLDVQQSTSLRDSVFERQPSPVDEVNPWGSLAKQTVWSML